MVRACRLTLSAVRRQWRARTDKYAHALWMEQFAVLRQARALFWSSASNLQMLNTDAPGSDASSYLNGSAWAPCGDWASVTADTSTTPCAVHCVLHAHPDSGAMHSRRT